MKSVIRRAKEIGILRFLKKATFYDEIYSIGIREKTETENGINVASPFYVIPQQTGYWMADPLLFTHKGKDWLYVELFHKANHRGCIAVIDPGSQEKVPRIIITEPYHMSFPMVFEWNDAYFMIPETSENRSLNLYKSIHMPYEWELVKSFPVEMGIVDSIVLSKTESSVQILGSEVKSENELFARFQEYEIRRDRNDYSIHLNHSVRDFNLAERNGGVPIEVDTQALLVTQNSTAIDYGVSISLCDYYDNKLHERINYDKTKIQIDSIHTSDIIGIHTYSVGSKYEVIDCRYLKFDLLLNFKRIKRVLQNNWGVGMSKV